VDRIARLDELLQKQLPKLYMFLQRPAEKRKVSAAERKIGVELPDSLRALYAWKDGSDLPFFGDFALLSVTEAAKHHKKLMDAFQERAAILHDAPWIPFLFDCDRHLYLCVDAVGSFGGAEGQIIAASLWEEGIEIPFANLDAWLDTVIAMIEGGSDPRSPSREGPKRGAWDRSLAAARRKVGIHLPRRVDAYVETLRGRIEQATAKDLLLAAAIENEHGEMRRATLELLRVVSPERGAEVAFELAHELLRQVDAKRAKMKKKGDDKRSAEEAYEECVEVWEDICDALIAGARLKPSRMEEAALVFKQAIATGSSNGVAFYLYFKLGYFYDTLGNTEQAIEAYQAAVDLHGKRSGRLKRAGLNFAHNNLGVLLERRGDLEEAVAMYRIAIELSPKDGIVRKGLADTLMRMGRPEEALAEYRRAVKSSSEWLGAWTALVTCCRKLGLDVEAESALARAWSAANGSEVERVEQACLFAVEGDEGSALEALRESVEADPNLRPAMRRDLDFEALWSDPRFLEIVS
jgi:tetratricopeptide (TPR) repeat protein